MSNPRNDQKNGLTYKDAGVDIDAGDALVSAIGPLAASTNRPGVMEGLGGFGALFDLKAAGFEDPILVSGTDGVGTKLKVAIETGLHETVGIDLVAMCANDIVVQGAAPLFFLDYFATGKLDPEHGKAVVSGIAEGCRQAGCALIGGETAEMPGMYADGDYDLAGFCVGAMERGAAVTGDTVATGDVVIGLASSGVHSNGFSLVRKVIEVAGLSWDAPAPFADGLSIGAAFLEPTRMYVRPVLQALATGHVKAMSHITGGGLTENLPRTLPDDLGAVLDVASWTPPACFGWLAKTGGIEPADMLRTFNSGIGYCVIAEKNHAAELMDVLSNAGEQVAVIGRIEAAPASDGDAPRVRYENLSASWPA